MLRLNLNPAPYWIDLAGGVRVEVIPPSSRMMLELRILPDAPPAVADPDGKGVELDYVSPAFLLAYGKALAIAAIVGWEGVVGDDDAPAPVTPENVTALMDIFQCYAAFRDSYITPALTLAAEGNVCAPLPTGTLAGVPATVTDVTGSATTALDVSTAP
jgi:hypothetical protein